MKKDQITIECPKCKRSRKTPRHHTDPQGTVKIVLLCPKCDNGGGFEQVDYFDADGKQILVP